MHEEAIAKLTDALAHLDRHDALLAGAYVSMALDALRREQTGANDNTEADSLATAEAL